MDLRTNIRRAIKASGLRPYTWAETVAGLRKSTFRGVMRSGTATGRTLALLQRAGVLIANRKVIASLDAPDQAA